MFSSLTAQVRIPKFSIIQSLFCRYLRVLNKWMVFFAPSPGALKFAVKTLIASGLALWCAFRFDLDQPHWALMTVFIVSQQMSGMVLAKGLFRLLGTIFGTFMAVVLMGLFSQTPWLFVIAMSVWLGICTALASGLRNHVSYAFVLAGYTVGIICLPAIHEPLQIFDHAVARCTEICLGILCASALSALLWPQRVEQSLDKQARKAWEVGMKTARAEIAPEEAGSKGLLNAFGKIVEVDAQRDHAWFEGAQGRQRARALRLLSRDLLSLLRTSRGVSRQLTMLEPQQAEQLNHWIDAVLDCLEHPQKAPRKDLRQRLEQTSIDPLLSSDQRYCLARCAVLLRKVDRAERSMLAVASGEVDSTAVGSLSWHRDWQLSSFYGLRTGLAIFGLSVFWIFTAWPMAPDAMTLTAVVCSVFAGRDNAVQIGMGFLKGTFFALPVAVLITQWLLPQWNGFPLLCLALGVPLFFAALGMASPLVAGTAAAFGIHLIVMVVPHNHMNYDLAFLFNTAQGMLLGIGFAVMVFRVMSMPSSWLTHRLLRATSGDLARLTRRPLADAENWFGGRMADRLLRLANHANLMPINQRRRWGDGLMALDLGNELIHLRACLEGSRGPVRKTRDRLMSNLAQLLEQGPSQAQAKRMETITEPLLMALADSRQGETEAGHLAAAAVSQLRYSWQKWCEEGTADGVA